MNARIVIFLVGILLHTADPFDIWQIFFKNESGREKPPIFSTRKEKASDGMHHDNLSVTFLDFKNDIPKHHVS